MLALALGARRLFADVWFVRLLQYYGTAEIEEGWSMVHEAAHHEAGHYDAENGGGKYPEFLPRSRHILEIDPNFTAAGLYGAASLAFNMNRPGEAEELLNFGLKYSPREWKYLSVLAAIGYSKARSPRAVAEAIAPLLKDPDCPVMLKQQSAFLNKKAGNYAAAAAIYADIAATSKDTAYVNNAKRELEKLSRLAIQR
jgi:predicted Zn-dependent protease